MFLDGVPLREIAAIRARSYATIRNQFQSILDKTGCDSQTALFRLSFSFLQLAQQTGLNVNPALQTDGREMLLPRPKGRVVALRLNGDEMGQPLLNFGSLFGHGVTPQIDDKLRDRGILLISVSRPGFGATSPPHQTQDLYDCLAGDVRATLDSLEIDACPAIARASAARPFYNLIARLPDRISKAVLINGMIPRNYIANKSVASQWTQALMKASIMSFPIAKLILATGSSLLKRSEGATFLTKMYQDSAEDRAALRAPEVVLSIRRGVERSARQGLMASAEDIVGAFQDWSDDLQHVTSQVTVYHGRDDPNVPIAGVREFVRDNPKQLKLVEEVKGGGQLCFSHIDRILDLALLDSA
jgi:pimeloyl-ACP methyl ester carboxylesterase